MTYANFCSFPVAQNTSLHEFLDSYLQFRHRWYDLPHRGPKGTVAGLVVGELELCRRVFMVLYRMWAFYHFPSFVVLLPFHLSCFRVLDPRIRIPEQVVASPLAWRSMQVKLCHSCIHCVGFIDSTTGLNILYLYILNSTMFRCSPSAGEKNAWSAKIVGHMCYIWAWQRQVNKFTGGSLN